MMWLYSSFARRANYRVQATRSLQVSWTRFTLETS
jgi:hypothetical protein